MQVARIFHHPLFLFRCRMKEHLAYGDWQEQEISPVAHNRLHLQALNIRSRRSLSTHTHVYILHTLLSPSEPYKDHMHGVYQHQSRRPSFPYPQRFSQETLYNHLHATCDGKGAWLRNQKLF